MKLTIIIPTFNEKESIARLLPLIADVLKKVKRWKSSILVVDDNSPDGTARVVEHLIKKYKNVSLLLRKKKTGLGAAYLAGMAEAFENLKADVILVMDADLSHDPRSIPFFLEKIENGADIVIGSRYTKGGSIPKGWSPHRKVLSVLGNQIVPLMLGRRDINDWTSGYRAIKRKVYQKVSPLMVKNKRAFKGYTFNIAFAYYTIMAGFRVEEVPIKFIDRRSGESKLGLEYLFNTPIFLLRTRLGLLFDSILKL